MSLRHPAILSVSKVRDGCLRLFRGRAARKQGTSNLKRPSATWAGAPRTVTMLAASSVTRSTLICRESFPSGEHATLRASARNPATAIAQEFSTLAIPEISITLSPDDSIVTVSILAPDGELSDHVPPREKRPEAHAHPH